MLVHYLPGMTSQETWPACHGGRQREFPDGSIITQCNCPHYCTSQAGYRKPAPTQVTVCNEATCVKTESGLYVRPGSRKSSFTIALNT